MAATSSPARGTDGASVVRAYLVALREHRPQRGRPKDPKRVERQLDELEKQIEASRDGDPLRTLKLVQRRVELRQELEGFQHRNRLQDLTEQFVLVVREYSAANEISFEAWRELGVPVTVLRRGGMSATSTGEPAQS